MDIKNFKERLNAYRDILMNDENVKKVVDKIKEYDTDKIVDYVNDLSESVCESVKNFISSENDEDVEKETQIDIAGFKIVIDKDGNIHKEITPDVRVKIRGAEESIRKASEYFRNFADGCINSDEETTEKVCDCTENDCCCQDRTASCDSFRCDSSDDTQAKIRFRVFDPAKAVEKDNSEIRFQTKENEEIVTEPLVTKKEEISESVKSIADELKEDIESYVALDDVSNIINYVIDVVSNKQSKFYKKYTIHKSLRDGESYVEVKIPVGCKYKFPDMSSISATEYSLEYKTGVRAVHIKTEDGIATAICLFP